MFDSVLCSSLWVPLSARPKAEPQTLALAPMPRWARVPLAPWAPAQERMQTLAYALHPAPALMPSTVIALWRGPAPAAAQAQGLPPGPGSGLGPVRAPAREHCGQLV